LWFQQNRVLRCAKSVFAATIIQPFARIHDDIHLEVLQFWKLHTDPNNEEHFKTTHNTPYHSRRMSTCKAELLSLQCLRWGQVAVFLACNRGSSRGTRRGLLRPRPSVHCTCCWSEGTAPMQCAQRGQEPKLEPTHALLFALVLPIHATIHPVQHSAANS